MWASTQSTCTEQLLLPASASQRNIGLARLAAYVYLVLLEINLQEATATIYETSFQRPPASIPQAHRVVEKFLQTRKESGRTFVIF